MERERDTDRERNEEGRHKGQKIMVQRGREKEQWITAAEKGCVCVSQN